MAKLLSVTLALIGCTLGEPPVNYNYHSSSVPQWNSYNAFSGGGSYTPVPVGPQTSEGYHVDPHLLEKIKHIILKDEINNGPQEYSEEEGRIVGIEVIGIQQSIEVAQYHQSEGDSGTSSNGGHNNHGDSSDSHSKYYSEPSQSYELPSKAFGHHRPTPPYDNSKQSSSYDVPIESSYESAPSSAPESDYSFYSSAPSSGDPDHSDDNHNSYNTPANVYGSTSSQNYGPLPSSYEEPHSINARKVRRTSPFYSAYRPTFYNFRY